MTRLSSDINEIKPEYRVVVVGSGYGGGVAASRLSRAGQSVCVLERGQEFLPGDFPDTLLEGVEQTQGSLPGHERDGGPRRFGSRLGLYDFHIDRDLNVLTGCGLGGTSLINAGVALEASPEVFTDERWPPELIADLPTRVAQGYRRAREVLRPTPYPADLPTLAKQRALARSAAAMGEPLRRLPLCVTFEDRVNAFGVTQTGCALCGDCVTGCNYGAKNTVAHTYLPDAWNHGAELFTEVSVRWIAARDDGRWLVYYEPVEVGREAFADAGELFVVADVVILAAGSLGSTEILLRSRARGLALSDRLGRGFTGNGDVLAFAYNCDEPIHGVGMGAREPREHAPVGPTITSAIDGREGRPLPEQFLIEEGAIPGVLSFILPHALSSAATLWGADTDHGAIDYARERGRAIESHVRGAYEGAVDHTQTYLVVGHDSGAGVLHLDDDERLRITWPGAAREPIVELANRVTLAATAANGGTFLPNPMWSPRFEAGLITVHPLGGCAMGRDASAGVTDHKGQVFKGTCGTEVHAGLYVADGAVIPAPLGVNPLLTISALAERAMALLAEDRGWTIEYALGAAPDRAAPGRGVGVRFTERMTGVLTDAVTDEDYERARASADAQRHACSFTLTLSTRDLDALLRDPAHRMRAAGTVHCAALSPRPLRVSDGVFQLLAADPDAVETTRMIYEMNLTSDDDRRYSFRGFKVLHDDRGVDLWADATTLYTTIRAGHDPEGAVVGRGILRITPTDFARQLTTLKVTGARSRAQRVDAMASFGRFFAGSLFDTYGGVFASPTRLDPSAPARRKRPLRAPAPELHGLRARDGVELRLTRYRGGPRGPVLLLHGLGVSSSMFTLDTIETNLVEYLCAHDYDVWLLDLRVSVALPAAERPWTLDTIAALDVPAAAARIRERTGARDLQVVAHGLGATALLMSLLSGALTGVRSAVASQSAAHVHARLRDRLSSGLHVPGLLDALGVDTLTARSDRAEPWYEKLYERALSLSPRAAEERCRSAVCHRVSFMYAPLYEHDQLNAATHDTLHELFAVTNVTTLKHLARLVRARRLVDAEGRDVYMPHVARLALPLTLIHGAENQRFDPSGSERTLQWLRAHHDPARYELHVIPDFGHLDCIIGKRAAAAVYPKILAHLERHAAPTDALAGADVR